MKLLNYWIAVIVITALCWCGIETIVRPAIDGIAEAVAEATR